MAKGTSTDTSRSGGDDAWHASITSHRERERGRILHTAATLLAQDGYGALSMSALADAAGISRQTLYKYFADADAVVTALALAANDAIVELAQRASTAKTPREGLVIFIEAVIAAGASGHPSSLALAASAPSHTRADVRAHERTAEDVVVDLLERGRSDGTLRADLDPRLDGRILFRAMLATHDLAGDDDVDVADLAERATADLLRMVERPRGRR